MTGRTSDGSYVRHLANATGDAGAAALARVIAAAHPPVSARNFRRLWTQFIARPPYTLNSTATYCGDFGRYTSTASLENSALTGLGFGSSTVEIAADRYRPTTRTVAS